MQEHPVTHTSVSHPHARSGPGTKDRVEDIMDVAGLGDDYRELLALFELKEEED